MKKITLILTSALVCMLLLTSSTFAFSDIKDGAWYSTAVEYAVKYGLMDGVGENEFEPNSNMTRGMFVTVLYRYADSPKTGFTKVFNDIHADRYYAFAVCWAADNGIVNGVSPTEFEPDAFITREQIACIIDRFISNSNIDISDSVMASPYESISRDEYKSIFNDIFSDCKDISDYATEALMSATQMGFIKGDKNGCINPDKNLTRAEAATIFVRLYTRQAASGIGDYAKILSENNTYFIAELDDTDIERINQLSMSDEWETSEHLVETTNHFSVIVNGQKKFGAVIDTTANFHRYCILRIYDTSGERVEKTARFTDTNEKMLAFLDELASRDDLIPCI